MNDLGFRLEQIGGAWVKIRDDGRRGPAVADEAALWQEMMRFRSMMVEQGEELLQARAELDQLKAQPQAAAEKPRAKR